MDRLYDIQDSTKMGFAFLVCGAAFTFLGIVLFFDGTLMTMGSLISLVGIVLVIGTRRFLSYFSDHTKWRGGGLYLFGVFCVLRGHAFVGVLLQWFGVLNLFGNLFPFLFTVLQGVPYVSTVLRQPTVEEYIGHRLCGVRRSNV